MTLSQNVKALNSLCTDVDESIRAGATIVRVVGSWAMRPGSDDDDCVCMLCLYVINRDAFDAGSVPEPELEDAPLMLRDEIYTREGDILATGNKFTTHRVNVRAKRKIRSKEDQLVAHLENINAAATALIAVWNLRTLLWVP